MGIRTKYGEAHYYCESKYEQFLVYGITDISIKVGGLDTPPKVSLLRTDKNGRVYFIKHRSKIYLDTLIEVETF